MKQLTLRGFDEQLSNHLQRLAGREGISLNKAALRLLRKGAGLTVDEGVDTVGSSLDHLIGTWTEDEADHVDSALADFEVVDESAWA